MNNYKPFGWMKAYVCVLVFFLVEINAQGTEWDCLSDVYPGGAAYFRWKYDPVRTRVVTSWDYSQDGIDYSANIMFKDSHHMLTVDPSYEGYASEVCPTADCPSGDTAGMILHNAVAGTYRVSVDYVDATFEDFTQYLQINDDLQWNETLILHTCGEICKNDTCGQVKQLTREREKYRFTLKVDLRNARIHPPDILIQESGKLVKSCNDSFYCENLIQAGKSPSVLIYLTNQDEIITGGCNITPHLCTRSLLFVLILLKVVE